MAFITIIMIKGKRQCFIHPPGMLKFQNTWTNAKFISCRMVMAMNGTKTELGY